MKDTVKVVCVAFNHLFPLSKSDLSLYDNRIRHLVSWFPTAVSGPRQWGGHFQNNLQNCLHCCNTHKLSLTHITHTCIGPPSEHRSTLQDKGFYSCSVDQGGKLNGANLIYNTWTSDASIPVKFRQSSMCFKRHVNKHGIMWTAKIIEDNLCMKYDKTV